MKNIISFYNKKTSKTICYIKNDIYKTRFLPEFTSELENAFELEVGDDEFFYLYYKARDILNDIYNGNDHGNFTEHEYFHIRKDYFNDVKKSDIKVIILNDKLNQIRKLKLKKINKY